MTTFRTDLARKIFLDRYAMKVVDGPPLKVGQTVVFSPEAGGKYPRREIGTVVSDLVEDNTVLIESASGDYEVSRAHVDVPSELTYEEMCERVAKAIASVEFATDRDHIQFEFEKAMKSRRFVPAGRIMAGAGAIGDLTLYNCYVIPSPDDSREGILETARQQFEIMSRGGGVGINVSSLRPRYDYVKGVNGRSSGVVSWADLYSIITGKVEQGGSRRGALMLILDVWHPDILEFISSKSEIGRLDNANISIGLSDDFMGAVESDSDWDLVFPDRADPDYDEFWDGDLEKWRNSGREVVVYKTLKAREVYRAICHSAWASAEPGLFFVDRVNQESNCNYYDTIRCTNPCGEEPLPGWGVCNLGALNLPRFVRPAGGSEGPSFWPEAKAADPIARIDLVELAQATKVGVRFLDNVIDATVYVNEENKEQQMGERRVGLGVMGLAELLIRIGVRYGSPESVKVVDKVFETIRDAAYAESCALAEKKGPFPRYDDALLDSGFSKRLPKTLQSRIRSSGLRNVTLLTVAPTGTTGSMMGTSTGIEPYFMFRFEQRSNLGSNIVEEPVVKEFRSETGWDSPELPAHFVKTEDLAPEDHIGIMSTAQKYIDSAISKTMNLPNDYTVEQVESFYELLYKSGCKGGTVYRDGSRDEQCLVKIEDDAPDAPEPAPAVARPVITPLPDGPRDGKTISIPTHIGRCHVTLNKVDGDFFEVFISLARGGSDVDAFVGAIGRLVSLVLRLDSPVVSRERLSLVVRQLQGIASVAGGGAQPVSLRDRTRSVPDAIAKAIRTLLESFEDDEKAGDAEGGEDSGVRAEDSGFVYICPQCGNTGMTKASGCVECRVCGYSACG